MGKVADIAAQKEHQVGDAAGLGQGGQAVKILGHDPADAHARRPQPPRQPGGQVDDGLPADVDGHVFKLQPRLQESPQEDGRFAAVGRPQLHQAKGRGRQRARDLQRSGVQDFLFAAGHVVFFRLRDLLKEPAAPGVVKVHRRNGFGRAQRPSNTSRANVRRSPGMLAAVKTS